MDDFPEKKLTKFSLNDEESCLLVPELSYGPVIVIAPCGLRSCKNGPAPFPGQMSYKATKPGVVSVLYLSIHYMVSLFIRAPFYVYC